MNIFAETDRLILREIVPEDEEGLFQLDSDPEVHRFLGNRPVKNIEQTREMIQFIRKQYIDNGIGRWAIIEKDTNNFVGWTGLKLVTEITNNRVNYYDLGYRLIKSQWGKGYATETANASLQYAFEELNLKEVFAITDIRNISSKNVLEKAGLNLIETFDYDGIQHNWFNIDRKAWNKKSRTANRVDGLTACKR